MSASLVNDILLPTPAVSERYDPTLHRSTIAFGSGLTRAQARIGVQRGTPLADGGGRSTQSSARRRTALIGLMPPGEGTTTRSVLRRLSGRYRTWNVVAPSGRFPPNSAQVGRSPPASGSRQELTLAGRQLPDIQHADAVPTGVDPQQTHLAPRIRHLPHEVERMRRPAGPRRSEAEA